MKVTPPGPRNGEPWSAMNAAVLEAPGRIKVREVGGTQPVSGGWTG